MKRSLQKKYTFSVAANDEKMGSVAVEPQQDTYEAGTEIKVSAVPASEDYEIRRLHKRKELRRLSARTIRTYSRSRKIWT